MNRIILIGNGFDLAHDRETSYKQFINYFWNDKKNVMMSRLCANLRSVCGNPFCNIDPCNHIKLTNEPKDVNRFMSCLKNSTNNGYAWIEQVKKCYNHNTGVNIDYDTIGFEKNNKFLHDISEESLEDYWSGIEVRYYEELKRCLDDNHSGKKIEILQSEFSFIKKELEKYLGDWDNATMIPQIRKKIYSNINHNDFPGKKPSNDALETVMLLNFNYTKTAELYLQDINKPEQVIYIHGKLNDKQNPIIFGYGDESDETYQRIRSLKDNRYFDNIKSANYSQTGNYKKILDFIKSNEYQIFVMGHSCGVSDTDILKKLFLNENCLSIKVFYYKKSEGVDDFDRISYNIGSYFENTDSRVEKLVERRNSEPLLP